MAKCFALKCITEWPTRKKKVNAKEREQIKFVGQVTNIHQTEPAMVIEWPKLLKIFISPQIKNHARKEKNI
jgi:hypothetical protein